MTLVRYLAWSVCGAVALALLSGFFRSLDTLGAHDWDQMESHRYFVVKALSAFGQFPGWDPYGCGGFPAWGGPEAATIAASPLLGLYLALPLPLAVRAEVVVFVVALGLGTWFFARSYVESPLAIAFVIVVAAYNSRFALQIAVGHTWHLVYAGMPWVLGAFDRALVTPRRSRVMHAWAAIGAAVLAAMIVHGGTYPVLHTAMALLGLGSLRAIGRRKLRPMAFALAIVAGGAILSAPKLLPVAATMARFPRLTRSRETIDPESWLRMFTASVRNVPSPSAIGLDYMWHEYGQYVGVVPLALLVWANVRRLPADGDLRSLRFMGWAFVALALGGAGPWAVLHALPVLRSLRAPSRFTYPAFFFFAVVSARAVEDAARKIPPGRAVGLAASLALVACAVPIAVEDARCTSPWFAVRLPLLAERAGGYMQFDAVPPAYLYGDGDPNSPQGTNAAPGLLVRRANVGAIQCATAPGLNHEAPREVDGRPIHLGARGQGDPSYRGEVWLRAGPGSASVLAWSPAEVVVRAQGARLGDWLVLNQNWDPGWSANGHPTENVEDVNAYRLLRPNEVVTFRYAPPGLVPGLIVFGMGALAIALTLGLTPAAGRRLLRASFRSRRRL